MASNAENIENENNSAKNSLLRGSKLNPLLKSSMLRPSQFQFSSSSSTNELKVNENTSQNTSSPNTSKFNPFLKFQDSEEDDNSSASNDKKTDKEKTDTLSIITKNGLPKSNLFKPLQAPISENAGFVFGQNVHERVTGDIVHNSLNSEHTKKESDDTSENSNSPGLLFSNAAVQKTTDNNTQIKESNSKSLTEAAREYEESRAQKRKYDEVETITGEEDENNVLEVINCKLFAFVASTWEERGRGCLRLNDAKNDIDSSRVVFRTSGSLRVLLNTKIWRGMIAEQPSRKSLRLTAIDSNGHIKVFLIMAGPDDVELLHSALNERINIEKARKIDDIEEIKEILPVNDNDENGEPSPKKQIIDT